MTGIICTDDIYQVGKKQQKKTGCFTAKPVLKA